MEAVAKSPKRKALEKRALALIELEERTKRFPLYFYRPIEKIRPFHLSRARVRILAAGNRSGKSEANVAEACAFAMGYRPWVLRELGLPMPEKPWQRPENLPPESLCLNCEGIRVQIPNRVFIATGQSMRKGIAETLYPKIKNFLGPFITNEHQMHGGIPGDIELKNGARIYFGSAEQGNLAFESTNYTFNSIDEPVPRRVYTGIARGAIDQSAPIVMTFTPIGPWAGWIFQDLYQPSLDPRKKVSIESFNLSIFDNPYLPKKAVEEFVSDPALGEVEKQARFFGTFTHLVDVIYSKFSHQVHVIPQGYIPRDWYVGMAVDPHSIRPWFIAYFAVSPTGDVYFFKEWPAGDFHKIRRDPRSMEEYASLIRQLDGDLNVQIRIMDPNYGPRKEVIRGVSVPSIADDIARFGIYFHAKVNDDLNYGEAKVRSLLDYEIDKPISALNKPRLFFMENCPNLIMAMSMYTSKAKMGSDGEIEDEKRDETYKDGADVVRYVAVSLIANSASEDQWASAYSQSNADDLGLGYGESI